MSCIRVVGPRSPTAVCRHARGCTSTATAGSRMTQSLGSQWGWVEMKWRDAARGGRALRSGCSRRVATFVPGIVATVFVARENPEVGSWRSVAALPVRGDDQSRGVGSDAFSSRRCVAALGHRVRLEAPAPHLATRAPCVAFVQAAVGLDGHALAHERSTQVRRFSFAV